MSRAAIGHAAADFQIARAHGMIGRLISLW